MRPTIDCPTFRFLRTVIVANIALLFFMAPAARAVDFEWDGGGGADNRWSNAANWNQIVPPNGLNNIILTGASATGPVTIDVDGTQTINRIEHNGVQGDYTFGETAGADTITIFQTGGNALWNTTAGTQQDLIIDSNLLLNQGGGSVLRFNASNATDNPGRIVVNGNVSPTAAATGTISLALTSNSDFVGTWVTVNGVISDGPGATIGLIAGVETALSEAETADHSADVMVTGLNTFTGPVRVTGGELIFNSIENIGSSDPNSLGMPSAGNEAIVMGDLNIASGTLRYIGTSTESNTSNRPIQIVDGNTTATIDASGTVPLVLTGGITSPINNPNDRHLNLAGSNTGDNTISGVIGPAEGARLSVAKSGNGKWILTGSNSYDGGTTVFGGELVLQGAGARIGDLTEGIENFNISNGATFTLDGGTVVTTDLNNNGTLNFRSGQLTIRNNNTSSGAGSFTIGTNGAGTLQLTGGNQVFGNITLQGADDTLIASAGGTYQFNNLDNSEGGTVSGNSSVFFQINGETFAYYVDSGTTNFSPGITGTGGFTKLGAGTLVFDGTNAHTYAGETRIEEGTLRVTTGDLPTAPTYIKAGAELDLTNASGGDVIGRLSGAGTVMTHVTDNFVVNFTGDDGNFSGQITGTGPFVKAGAGKQILSGASDYTGRTTISDLGGTLEIASGGSIVGTSEINYGQNGTFSVAGGTIDTTGNIQALHASAMFNISSGQVNANAIDRTIGSASSVFTWTGGTVHLLTATQIAGGAITVNTPFVDSLTLTGPKTLIVDDTLSVLAGGTLFISGGSVTADTIVTGGTINFTSGTMQMRNDQTFDAARLAALEIDAPLGAGRNLIVGGVATINAPLTLAGGSFSAGQVINPHNLILSSGTLNVTNSDLAIAAATAVDVSSGMTVNVTDGALNNAGDLNVIGGAANFAAASTNLAGGEINAINATLTFTGGLTNNGDVNLINSTVNGSLVNGAGSNSSLLGSNSFGDDLVLAGGDTMLIDIAGGLPGEFDVVTVGGSATLDGLLSVSLTGGFSPTPGQQFTVLTANNIVDNGLALGGTAASSFSMLVGGTSVILQALAPGLPGDYNDDGKVDAADYAVWRKNEGTNNVLPNNPIPGTIGAAQYNQWRANFGAPGGAGAGFGGAVPEPATPAYLFCMTAALLTAALRRRRPWPAT